MDDKDKLIVQLLEALNAAYKDACDWMDDGRGRGSHPQELECYEQVQAAFEAAKKAGYVH